MAEEFSEWELSHEIKTPQDALEYLQIAFEEAPDDTAYMQHLMGQIARALGMTYLANELGVARPSLYRSLSENGNPSFKTINELIRFLGGQISTIKRDEK